MAPALAGAVAAGGPRSALWSPSRRRRPVAPEPAGSLSPGLRRRGGSLLPPLPPLHWRTWSSLRLQYSSNNSFLFAFPSLYLFAPQVDSELTGKISRSGDPKRLKRRHLADNHYLKRKRASSHFDGRLKEVIRIKCIYLWKRQNIGKFIW